MLDDSALQTVFREVLADAGLPARDLVDLSLDAVTRADETTDYTFVINHGRTPLEVVVPEGRDLLIDRAVSGTLHLPAFGAAVIAAPRADGIPFLTLTDSPHKEGGHA